MPAAEVLLKALALWAAILVLAVLNGALREKALVPLLGAYAALPASGVILSLCIFAVALAATPWYGPLGAGQYWAIGVLWLLLTLAFEIAFGRFVQHKDWADLQAAYTFKGGNLWTLVLASTLLAPRLAAVIRRR